MHEEHILLAEQLPHHRLVMVLYMEMPALEAFFATVNAIDVAPNDAPSTRISSAPGRSAAQ